MSSNALESEDLLSVRLVRMEDVQPSRTSVQIGLTNNVAFNACVVNDEDSNIGSMVSIHSEDLLDNDNNSDSELIVPDILDTMTETLPEIKEPQATQTERWPTLEILPGGVIKNADRYDTSKSLSDSNEMIFACAKCSESFKHLFTLVKHVKAHEDEQKGFRGQPILKQNTTTTVVAATSKTIKNEYSPPAKRQKILIKSKKKKVPKIVKVS